MLLFFNGPAIPIFTGSAPFAIGRNDDRTFGSDALIAAAG